MAKLGYDDTPFLPGSPWRVHDGNRPQPPVVTPGKTFGEPPSDAVVLFDGTDLSKWRSVKDGGPARWKVENGYMEVVPGTGDIQTVEEFGDCQLHLEWMAEFPPKAEGQGRSNSGVFLMGRYEIQVLDCYQNITYPDGTTGLSTVNIRRWLTLVSHRANGKPTTSSGLRLALTIGASYSAPPT